MSFPVLINGKSPKAKATSYECTLATLDAAAGTGRSDTTGELFCDPIGSVRIVRIGVAPTTVEEMAELMQMVDANFVELTYLDSHDGAWRVDKFRVTDRGNKAMTWGANLTPGVSTDFSDVRWEETMLEFTGKGTKFEGEG